MALELEKVTDALLTAARRSGAEDADVVVVAGRSVSIGVRDTNLEQAERAEGTDIGLRVLIGGRQACVSTSDTSASTIETLAERAVAMAREAPEDPYAGLAGAEDLGASSAPDDLELADPSQEPEPSFLQETALDAEAAALNVDQVSQVQSAGASWSQRTVHLAATNGFSGDYARTDSSIYCTAIAGEGLSMQRDSDWDSRIFQSDLRHPREIGRLAGERAASLLGACKPPTGAFPVVFDERVSSSLIGHLLSAANGAAIARGASWLRGQLGEQVLPKGLSLVEDPHRRRATSSRPFDAEGLPTSRRMLIDEGGILTGWVLDLANARKLGLSSTANAVRGTSAPPSPSVWNVALTQGSVSRDALLVEMGTGLLVTSMIGSTINPNTGDYSRGVTGFWVENGEIAYPVNECTIAGSLPEMLKQMIPANDARSHLSRVVPSLLVEGLTLAGD